MKKIILVHCNNSDVGGSDINLYRLASECKKSGREISVIVSTQNPTFLLFERDGIPVTFVRMRRISRTLNPLVHCLWIISLLKSIVRLFFVIRKQQPDLVFANDYNEIAALCAARLCGVRCIVMLRMVFDAPTLIRKIYLSTLKRLADTVFCNSHYVRQRNFGDLKSLKGCVVTKYNWYEPLAAPVDDNLESLMAKLDASMPKKIILMPGRYEHWKGQHVILESMPRILEEHLDAILVFVGSVVAGKESYKSSLQRRAAELGLEDFVVFAQHMTTIAPLYELAAVVVHCSVKDEPFGMTVLEALSYETPLVASAAGGVMEIVGTPPAALLHKPGDESDLSEKVVSALSCGPDIEDLRRRGKSRAEYFSRRVRWPEYLAAMESVVQHGEAVSDD